VVVIEKKNLKELIKPQSAWANRGTHPSTSPKCLTSQGFGSRTTNTFGLTHMGFNYAKHSSLAAIDPSVNGSAHNRPFTSLTEYQRQESANDFGQSESSQPPFIKRMMAQKLNLKPLEDMENFDFPQDQNGSPKYHLQKDYKKADIGRITERENEMTLTSPTSIAFPNQSHLKVEFGKTAYIRQFGDSGEMESLRSEKNTLQDNSIESIRGIINHINDHRTTPRLQK